MSKRFVNFFDYVALFGVICMIPTGSDGALVMPLWASLSIVGGGLLGRLFTGLLGKLSFAPLNTLKK